MKQTLCRRKPLTRSIVASLNGDSSCWHGVGAQKGSVSFAGAFCTAPRTCSCLGEVGGSLDRLGVGTTEGR